MLYREHRMLLPSESSSGCKGAKTPRSGSLHAPVTPRVVRPRSRRASTGTLGASSPGSATPRRTSSPRTPRRTSSPASGGQAQDEQHRIFTSGLRGGREQSRLTLTSRTRGVAAASGTDSARSSACSMPAQVCRRRSDPSAMGRPDASARAATPAAASRAATPRAAMPRPGPKTTPKCSPRHRTPPADPTTHPPFAVPTEVQELNTNASSSALSMPAPESEPPITPPLSARLAESRLGTPPASLQPPLSSDDVQQTVVVPPWVDPATNNDCQSTPVGWASASRASTRASTPRVFGSTPGNDSTWDSRADDSSAGPSAAPTPTAPSYTIPCPPVAHSQVCCRGPKPTPVRHTPAAQRAASVGVSGSSDAGAAGRKVRAPVAGPAPRGFVDESHTAQSVPTPRSVIGAPALVFSPGSRPTYNTSLIVGSRTIRSGSASAVKHHPVGLCQPHVAASSRTLSPVRIEQMLQPVRCQTKL